MFRHTVSGTVRTSEGWPAGQTRVELQDSATGLVVGRTDTNAAGGFEIRNVRNGNYEVVAATSGAWVRERVEVLRSDVQVALRFPSGAAAEAGDRYSVSIAQLKVPGEARNAFRKAGQAVDRGRLEQAEKSLEQALGVLPDYAEALTLRAILHLDANRPEKARQDLERAVAADPSYALAYIVLGATYNRMGRFDDALKVLDRGLTISPRSWQGHYEMGKALFGKGDYEAALRQLNLAQEVAPPDYYTLHLVKAYVYLRLRKYDHAIPELELYLGVAPKDSPDALRAQKELERARASAQNSPVAQK